MELTTAILAALYQRERTGRGQSIDVSMAETMLFVNDHLNGELWDGPEDPQSIRNFAPGDYIVFTDADGDSVIVSGHPAERGTFELFLRAFDVEHLADDPRFVDVASRKAQHRRAARAAARGGREDPRRGDVRGALRAHHLAVGRLRSARDLARLGVGRGTRGDRRGVRPRRRHDPHPATRRGTSARPRSGCAASRGTAARTTAPCSPTCSATTTPPSTPSRPTGCCRAGCHHRPGDACRSRSTPMKATLGHAADRGRRVGVRDQVGRLPHAGLRRRRRRCGCRARTSTTSRAKYPELARAGRRASAPAERSSTASSSCSTTPGGRASS